MHPVLSQPHRLRLFITIWPFLGAAVGVLPFLFAGGRLEHAWPAALWGELLVIPVLASTFVCRSAPVATSNPWRVLATIGLAAAISAGFWLEAGQLGLWLLSSIEPEPNAVFEHMALPAAIGAALVFALACAVSYALIAVDENQAFVARALTADINAREAELRALRAQVNPHFLFNCLHSISSLTGSNPAAARQACIELAEFFRESLRAGSQPRIPLSTEIELVRRYLAIEHLRFGDRLGVDMNISPDIGATTVPPLLLQPLVENAVRHGIATLLDGGTISMVVTRLDGRVSVTVENPFDPDEKRHGAGVGLRNVRARLETTYGSAAAIRAESRASRYIVSLSFPMDVRPPAADARTP